MGRVATARATSLTRYSSALCPGRSASRISVGVMASRMTGAGHGMSGIVPAPMRPATQHTTAHDGRHTSRYRSAVATSSGGSACPPSATTSSGKPASTASETISRSADFREDCQSEPDSSMPTQAGCSPYSRRRPLPGDGVPSRPPQAWSRHASSVGWTQFLPGTVARTTGWAARTRGNARGPAAVCRHS